MRHQLLDTTRIRTELGYHEPVTTDEAIRKTVDWYLAHPPEPGGEQERQLGDPFDYTAEDAYRAVLERAEHALAETSFAGNTYGHPYDHPRGAQR